jgi:hypothetical protein
MPKGEASGLVEGYRASLKECLPRLDSASLMKLRGEIQVVSRWLAVNKKEEVRESADTALESVSQLHRFGLEIGGFSASTRSAETASFFDLAAVGLLAVENILTAEKPSLMRFLMSGLSEGLMFLGSRQYVAGSGAVLQATYQSHSIAVQDALWSLAADFRDPEDLGSIREARAAIDALFAQFNEPGIPVGTKLQVLHQLYGLVAIIRCAKLLGDLRALE